MIGEDDEVHTRMSCDRMSTALASLIESLGQDRSLHEPRRLRERMEALDSLEVFLSDGRPIEPAIHRRTTAIHAELQSVNSRLYDALRRDIQRGAGADSFLEWVRDRPAGNGVATLPNRTGYDYRDELVSGILRFEQPAVECVQLESEMVAYQPTPARHIFDLIGRAALTERDLLIDLGSGLGHVILMASICSGANCTGIELEPSYVDCARKSAQSLNLNNARFIEGDARAADLSGGTIFYLYTPFSGAILRDVVNSLRQQAVSRAIRIGTFGPCTRVVAEQPWLSPIGPRETDSVAIFRSRD